jgi:hypothetical protein
LKELNLGDIIQDILPSPSVSSTQTGVVVVPDKPFEELREEYEIKRSAPKKLRAACKTFKNEYANLDKGGDDSSENELESLVFNDRE